ncbi:SWIM zinc finger family protein [Proteiniclasticum sp.]|uniref:SWIM zinc finger family protein n=1 Tax=Proteiniclasticum sp. TaxID=2053595 RepID=UPI00289AD087|nr:SWIM zinc finger family protein [Proteiniclasticum sp.]
MNVQELIGSASEITKIKAKRILKENSLIKISYAKGVLRSVVHEGQDYSQKIEIEQGDISGYTCSCNSDGLLCPHILALLLKREERVRETLGEVEKKPKASMKNTKSNLKEILDSADKEELIEFILSLRSYYKDIPVIIRKSFISSTDEEFLRENRDELMESHNTLKATSNKEVYTKHFNLMLSVHERARAESKERNYLRSTLLYLLLFEMVSLPSVGMEHYLFDSHYIKVYQEALLPLADKKYTVRESQMIFDYLKLICTSLKDLSQITTLLRIMKNFITTEKDYDNYYDILLYVYEKDTVLPYDKNNLLYLEYELLMMIGKAEEASQLRRENPYVPEFRFMEAESHLGRGKLYDALIIVKDGIERADRNWDELIRWLYMESSIYKILQSQDKFIDVTQKLITLGEYRAYLDLKRCISPKEWTGVYEKLVDDEEVRKNTKGVYKRIILEEKDKRRILLYIMDNPELISEHYDFLSPEYNQEASKLLAEYIEDTASRISGRKDYEHLTQMVEKLYIYGQTALANDTIMNLVMKNKNKKSLHTILFQLKDTYSQSGPYIPE